MPFSWHLTADCLSVVWFLWHWVQLVWNIDAAAVCVGLQQPLMVQLNLRFTPINYVGLQTNATLLAEFAEDQKEIVLSNV